MSLNFVLYGLVPLAVFVLVDALSQNLRWAVVGAVICSFAELLLMYYSTQHWDPVSLAATALFVILGLMSLRLEDRIYFKFQPVVLSFIAAAFVAYLQFFDTPPVYRYLPLLKQAAPPIVLEHLNDPKFLETLNFLFGWVIVLILFEGLLIGYAALRWSNVMWLVVNAIGIWVLGAIMVVFQVAYLYFTHA